MTDKQKYIILFNNGNKKQLWSAGGGYTAFYDRADEVEKIEENLSGTKIRFLREDKGERWIDNRNELITIDQAIEKGFKHSNYMKELDKMKVYSKEEYLKAFANMSGYEWSYRSTWYVVATLNWTMGFKNKTEANKYLEEQQDK